MGPAADEQSSRASIAGPDAHESSTRPPGRAATAHQLLLARTGGKSSPRCSPRSTVIRPPHAVISRPGTGPAGPPSATSSRGREPGRSTSGSAAEGRGLPDCLTHSDALVPMSPRASDFLATGTVRHGGDPAAWPGVLKRSRWLVRVRDQKDLSPRRLAGTPCSGPTRSSSSATSTGPLPRGAVGEHPADGFLAPRTRSSQSPLT